MEVDEDAVWLPLCGINTIHARIPRQKIDPHPAVNHIYSNIRQIARCPRARELAPEQIAQLEFLADKLCEECFLLSTQQ